MKTKHATRSPLASALADLEAAAKGGDENERATASARLKKIKALLKPSGRGRPTGARTSEAREGATLDENASRARHGKGSAHVAETGTAAAGIVEQVWLTLNQPPAAAWGDAPPPRTAPPAKGSPAAARAEARALAMLRDLAAPRLLAAIQSGNPAFLEYFADVVKRERGGAWPVARSETEAAFLDFVRSKPPTHRFTCAAILDGAAWPARDKLGKGGAPDERTLGRLVEKFGVNLRRGRPPRKADIK
ncbi:hypothetical protein IMCC26134_12880 [Verrucomicrobia bacterium IMCC26134]|nr:hypothetical protein IMCC26134_12880 [Verrucomicrobia bacterium IMCC26134]